MKNLCFQDRINKLLLCLKQIKSLTQSTKHISFGINQRFSLFFSDICSKFFLQILHFTFNNYLLIEHNIFLMHYKKKKFFYLNKRSLFTKEKQHNILNNVHQIFECLMLLISLPVYSKSTLTTYRR